MLNLRDLIFSPPKSSQASDASLLADPDDDDGDYDDDDDDDGRRTTSRSTKRKRKNKLQKLKRYVRSDPMPSAVYTTHPEVVYYRTRERTTRDVAVVHPEVLQYVPGMSSYLQFRQAATTTSELIVKRNILRAVFNECFYGRDYPGACDTLRTLADVDAVGRPELERLVEMLRHTTDAQHWLKLLLANVTGMLQVPPVLPPRRSPTSMCTTSRSPTSNPLPHTTPPPLQVRTSDPTYKATFIQTFVEVAVADGDIAVAQGVLRDRLADVAYTRSPTLIAYHALLLVAEAVEFVHTRWPAFAALGGDGEVEPVSLAQVCLCVCLPVCTCLYRTGPG
jgi:hypothetical protein